MTEYIDLSVADLIVDSAQSRRGEWTGDEADTRLVDSLKQDGLLQPLLVRPVGQTEYADGVDATHAIIAGSRRYHAALEAGFETVTCRVVEADDFTAAKLSLRENEERKSLSDQELARSLRMQFQLLCPSAPVTCPECGNQFAPDSIATHWGQSDHGPIEPEYPDGGLEDAIFYSKRQVHEFLAETHFGATHKGVIDKVRNLISIASLPDRLQALWKAPAQRTAAEQELLDRHGIARELQASGSGNSLSPRVRTLFRAVDQVADSDGLDPTTATLATVGRLNQGGITDGQLAHEVAEFESEITDELATTRGAEQRQVFEELLSNRAATLRSVSETLDEVPGVGKVHIELSEERYLRWHARAKEALGEESTAAVITAAYQDYLERMADDHGWPGTEQATSDTMSGQGTPHDE